MSTTERIVLITGATGRQGGAVARSLLGRGFRLQGMTRRPQSEAAQSLAKLGIEIVAGDMDDAESLGRALSGAWGVFAMQNTWEAGVEREEDQGKRLARVAREKGIMHFVYTSVASAQRKTGIPHFENKWRIEETVRGLKFPSHVIMRPVFFMENLPTPWFLHDDKLITAMKPATVLQMIAIEDIGTFGARAFTHAAEMNRREVDIAGDAVTMPQAAAGLGRGLKRNVQFAPIPIAEVRKNSADFASMLEWFDRVGYDADIAKLERDYGFHPMKLDAWVAKHVRP